ncbi:fibronectin type III domain-containing protein [Pseudactinotalea sp. Z1748]|uniref:fibronectin type III domain-containing protein n=1 Tax=Pseudactinotalea sp. Z1748 TaxID=3413027 RepID=UPI003C7A959F
MSWLHVPTDGSGQERFQVRHRLQGGDWTTVSAVASATSRWTLPGGTYEPGDVFEWQVRTWGVHPDPGPYSASNFQSPTSRPTVAINEPVDGTEIDTSSVLVTWGYSGPDQGDGDEGEISGQAGWRLTLLRGSNVVTEESGSDDRDEFLVRGLSDDATYTIRVEVRSGEGLWSAEPDEVTFPVSYLPPPPPQIGVAFDRDLGAAVVDVQTAPPHEPYEYVNVVTNPRGRPADPDAEADPLAARQALLDALAAYTDAPVQWSATEPGDTSVVWVDPDTGVGRVWTPEWERLENPVLGFYGWDEVGSGPVEYVSASHVVLNGGQVRMPNESGAPVPGDASTVQWRVQVRSTEVRPGESDAAVHFTRYVDSGTGTGNVQGFPADGQWHFVTTQHSLDAGAEHVRILIQSGTSFSSPSLEVRRVQVAFNGEDPGPWLGDGDSPGWEWDGTPQASTSHRPARDAGWHEIIDPDVVAAGEAYADAVTALAPVGWTGDGLWWSIDHDAVYVPAGVSATVPTEALPETLTLVLLDAETGESAQYWDRTDATIPADTVGRYLRAAIVEGGMFTGPYFDGDYPRGPGQDGSLATYAWDGQPHDSPTTATITSLETESVQLWRAIDDGPWLLIADGVPPDTAISDPIPAPGDRRVNHYRATSVSVIGSAMHSDEHELVVPTHGPGGNHGWVYLNGGTDFSDVVRVRANATRSGSQGLAKSVRRYAGNPRAQERSGTAEHRTWSISVNAREQLYEDGASRPEDIDTLQRTGGVICYRDPLGARWFASMGMMDDSYRGITGEVSWSMEEVDQPEGLATEARDQSHGDEDDDPGEDVPE